MIRNYDLANNITITIRNYDLVNNITITIRNYDLNNITILFIFYNVFMLILVFEVSLFNEVADRFHIATSLVTSLRHGVRK